MAVTLPPISSFVKTVNGKKYTYFKCSFGRVGSEIVQYSNSDRMLVAKWREQKAKDINEIGEAASELTSGAKLDAVLAIRVLPEGVSLLDAASFYAQNKGGIASITVEQGAEQYIEARQEQLNSEEIRETTFMEVRVKIGALSNRFGSESLGALTPEILLDWMRDVKKLSPNSIYQYINVLGTFFKWAVRNKYLVHNPLEDVKRPKRKRNCGNASFLSVADAVAILTTAAHQVPEMVPYFALGMFAGIRPYEAQRLQWDSINLDEGVIRIESSVSKTDDARVVEICSALRVLLAEYYSKEKYVIFTRKKFDKVKKLSGVKWSDDLLRHTFATYHLALHQSADKTAYQMGHRDADLLFRHYKGMTNTTDAQNFWSIML